MSVAAHIPIRRVLERTAATPDVRPRRIFPLLLPVWGVRTRAVVWDAQPYEVFDQYLSQAIAGAGLREASRLADFFAVEPALIDRALTFLESIGHLRRDGATLALTELGRLSVAAGCRYVPKRDEQVLYFDGFGGAPFPKTHYSGAVWLDAPELELPDGTRFRVVAGSPSFRMDALGELTRRPDRERFNLPGDLTSIEAAEVRNAWLPAYVVECASSLLVFVKAVDGPDEYLSSLVTPYISDALNAQPRIDEVTEWQRWLAARGLPQVRPVRLPNGVLRASLPSKVIGDKWKWWQLGSFEYRHYTFLQLWCDDAVVRLQAVLARAGTMISRRLVRDRTRLERKLTELASQLEVPVPDVEDLRAHARYENDDLLLAMLDRLPAGE